MPTLITGIAPGPEFTEAAEVHSNDDDVSRHRLAPYNAYYLTQRFSNFFDHGPLFSPGIVGGPPHFRVATFALSQSGTGVRPFPSFPPLPPFPLPSP